MEKKGINKEREVQKLQKHISDLELKLKDARSALDALTPREGVPTEAIIHPEGSINHVLFEAPYPVMIWRDDGRVVMINKVWSEITGYTIEDIPTIEEWMRKAYDEESANRQFLIQRQGYSQKEIKKWGEFEVHTHSGEKRIWDFSSAPLGFDEKGRELVMFMTVDVTERRQAEDARAESERQHKETARLLEMDRLRLSTILEHLPVGVWITDKEGKLIGKNSQADRIWAGDAPLLNGIDEYPQYVSWHPDSSKMLEADEYPIAKALKTGQPVEREETNIRRFDGSIGTVLVSAVPIKDSDGQITGVVAINVDITSRKQAERALRDGEERFSKTFRKAPFGMNITRWRDGVILDVNDAWLNMLGWTREEVLGKSTAEFPFYVRTRQREVVRQRIMNDESMSDMELHLVRKDGTHLIATVATTIIEVQGERCILGVLNDITDRKQAEQALRDSEHRYRSLFEMMQEGLIAAEMITDDDFTPIDYRYLDVNPAAEIQFGVPRERFIGHTYTEVLPERDQEWIQLLGQVALTGQPASVERFSEASGRWFDAHVYSPRAGEFITILNDITERKRAEQALKESEHKFFIMFDKAPFAAALSRLPEGVITNVNEQFEQIFGYTRQEATGRTYPELGLNPDVEGREQIVAELQENGSVRNIEIQLDTKSGRGRIFLLNIDMVAIGEEKYALQTVQEITESKKAEEALRESEQRFHSLADSMPQLVWTALPDGTVDYYNRRYQEYRDIKRVEGEGWEWSPVLHPDDFQSTVDAWHHAVSTGEVYQAEHRVRIADGSFRWHLSRGVPVFDENGHVTRWFGTATDIHEQKMAQENLKLYTERLERSNRELEQFAFVASHDLQEPLRKIQVFGDLLLERSKKLEENEREYVKRMRDAAGRMREMVHGLLQLSRVNTQHHPLTHVDLSQVTLEAVSDLVEQIEREKGTVDVDPLPQVTGDPLQLRQLMQNLISNALKYHKPGVSPRVKIHTEQSAEAIRLFVKDNGIGFDQADVERIFQPFQRLVGRSEYEGSGMGLAICRKIVDRHGGDITAQSKPGEGTTFVISLPIRPLQNSAEDTDEHKATDPDR